MTAPDVLVESFDTVLAAITRDCPDCGGYQVTPSPDRMVCGCCDGSGRVSVLDTITLPEGLPYVDDGEPYRQYAGGGHYEMLQDGYQLRPPFTVGLIIPGFDAVAAARIEADTGWRVLNGEQTKGRYVGPIVVVNEPGNEGASQRSLPVGRVVATATCTECHEATWDPDPGACCAGGGMPSYDEPRWHWRLSDVALVAEPYDPPSDVPAVGAS